ncbi:ATP-binding cassette domain-containing protein [Roseicyclus sp.]|uniref:ATP-binding cassette domain-containing protein n=1 Tax=Roseicyclus sp. TaxID=1914329 RepID=UPI0026148E63|nr:ATP-binding cassette domain-containing protein [Roseicyclus sp.]
MGENGAGKSTLMKVLGGIYQPIKARLSLNEVPTVMTSPLQAKLRHRVYSSTQPRRIDRG